jgi:hypothetical protein
MVEQRTSGELAVLALRETAIKQAMDADIAKLFTPRVLDPLRAAGYRTLADVYRAGEIRVACLNGMGRKGSLAIRSELNRHGFDMGLWALARGPRSPSEQHSAIARQALLSASELRAAATRLLRLAERLEFDANTPEVAVDALRAEGEGNAAS